MSATDLFDNAVVAKHDRYRCVLCGKEIQRRPKGARVAHAMMHVRKGEAYCRRGNAPFYNDEYYAGPKPADDPRVYP